MARPNESGRRGESDREQFGEQIGKKEQRKIKGRCERRRSPLFWAGMFGLVGWPVALFTVLGVWLGRVLDQRYTGTVSWTLTGVFLGITLGCINAWLWVKRESSRKE